MLLPSHNDINISSICWFFTMKFLKISALPFIPAILVFKIMLRKVKPGATQLRYSQWYRSAEGLHIIGYSTLWNHYGYDEMDEKILCKHYSVLARKYYFVFSYFPTSSFDLFQDGNNSLWLKSQFQRKCHEKGKNNF